MSKRVSPIIFEDEEDSIYYSNLIDTSSLPLDHKPAKGRGRAVQLSKMTKQQREDEKFLKLEKNRLAAKGSRLKKKRKLTEMEERITYLEKIISNKGNGKNFMEELKKKDERIEILQGVLYNQSITIQRLLEKNGTK